MNESGRKHWRERIGYGVGEGEEFRVQGDRDEYKLFVACTRLCKSLVVVVVAPVAQGTKPSAR